MCKAMFKMLKAAAAHVVWTIERNRSVTASTGGIAIGGNVYGDIYFNPYYRTAQGIPLQRPPQAEHLVGREELLRELLAALQPGKAVTLCGPGGIGKTALASRAVWELAPGKELPARFPDGLIFYSFYGRKDVSLAFAHFVRSYDEQQQDTGPEAARQLLAGKQALIILDGAEEADDLSTVLRCCGGCGLLITSRKRSDAPGGLLEVSWLDKLPAAKAFRLYSGTDADAATVQAICTLLGGWPVALRIAGRYCSSTGESAADYLRFLSKVPFRRLGSGQHQEENAALLLRRSVEKVSGDAQQVLRLTGVLAFAPIGLGPVMAVLAKEGEDQDELELRSTDALNELVTYGLLERRSERWQISHALIHTYARTELALSKESLERLAGWYIAFCEAASAEGVRGYAALDAERAHCLRLIDNCLASKLWQEVQALENAIDIYLERQGWWTDQLSAVEMRLTAARLAGDRKDEGWCLNSLGYTCEKRGEPEKALSYFEQSLLIYRDLGDRQGEGVALNSIAMIYGQQSKHELALETYQHSLSIAREVGDRKWEGATLNNIANVYNQQGNWEKSSSYLEQALPIRREAGDDIGGGQSMNNIASIYRVHDNYAKSLRYYEPALVRRQQLEGRAGEAVTSWNIGLDYIDSGELAKAEEHISQAVQIEEAIGSTNLEYSRKGLARVQAMRRG